MRDHLEGRESVEEPFEHDVRHGGARLVRPAEGPPDLVVALLFLLVVGKVGAARRVHPDGQIELGHQREQRQRIRRSERRAQDIGEDLHADRAELAHRAFGLVEQPLRIVHRQRSDESREAARVLRDQLGHAVVGEPRQLGGKRRRPEDFDRRRAQADHLRIVAEQVHDAKARVEIDDRRDRTHALVHVPAVGRDLEHPVVEARRKDVIEDVELHGAGRE